MRAPMPLYEESLSPLEMPPSVDSPALPEPEPPARRDFASFYRATLAPLRRYLGRLLGNKTEAQDLAHDAYARVYAAMEGRQIEQPKAFLFTTARRLAINQLKRRQIAPVRESDGKIIELTPSDRPGVERVVMARQEWENLEIAIAALPPGCRAVLLLCKVEHLSHAEIGAKLGIAISTVEKQHARALRLLRAALQETLGGERGGSRP
jgi:RNA polymerase sigma factor (sigma-70 family)